MPTTTKIRRAEKAVTTSEAREEMRKRTNVPSNKLDYRQKLNPDNPKLLGPLIYEGEIKVG